MPTFADALKALDGLEGGSEFVAVVKARETELNREAAKYRTRAKSLGEYLGIDPATEDLDGALEAHRSKSTQSKGKVDPELEARLKRVEGELENERKLRTDAETSARSSKAQAAIKDALSKGKALRPDDLAGIHMASVKFREDGSPYFVDAFGAERTVDEYVGKWLKERPELVSSTQPRGPGGGGPSNVPAGARIITQAEYDAAVGAKNVALISDVASGKAIISQE